MIYLHILIPFYLPTYRSTYFAYKNDILIIRTILVYYLSSQIVIPHNLLYVLTILIWFTNSNLTDTIEYW
jgi:hypothetical protein